MQRASSWRWAAWGVLCIGCIGCLSCQVLLDVEPQCESAADCERLFGAGHVCGGDGVCAATSNAGSDRAGEHGARQGQWACLNTPFGTRAPEPANDRTLELGLTVYDYLSGEPVEGAAVRACSHADVACTRPTAPDQTTDADGAAQFELPYGFDGHFELNAEHMMPVIMSDDPLTEDGSASVPMLSAAALDAIAMEGGERYDAKRGCVLFDVLDCEGQPAAGVSLEAASEPENRPFYFNNQLPTRDVAATLVSAIGTPSQLTALAGFVNVRPGFVTFRATLAPNQQHLTYATLQVRARTLTLTRFRPGVP